jgi:photosystem II stability/assembly factor-like uncharacterized protein
MVAADDFRDATIFRHILRRGDDILNDRVSARPNTYTMVTNADGTVTLTRADEPIVEGSLYNKANMLPDDACNIIGIPTTAEPKDAFVNLGRIGDIVSGKRIDFLQDDRYRTCDGSIVSIDSYPVLSQSVFTNLGYSWIQSTNTNGCFLCVLQLSTGRILAGSNDSTGIWKSDDDGVTWTQTQNTTTTVMSLCQTPTGRTLAGRNGSYMLKSDDNGETWSEIPYANVNWYEIKNVSNGRIVAASSNGIYYSDNNGDTWHPSNKTSGIFLSLCKTQSGKLLAGLNYGGIYYSNDNGSNWYATSNTNGHFRCFLQLSTGRILAGSGNSTGIWKSDDDGVTWTQLVQITGGKTISCFGKTTEGRLVAGGVNYGMIYSDDNGNSWNSTAKSDKTVNDIATLSSGRLVAVTSSEPTQNGIWYSDPTSITLPSLEGFYIKVKGAS